jgi:hypothetical protein
VRPRWKVVAHLVNDAQGKPVPPGTPGGSADAGEYFTRWGARRSAWKQAQFARQHRSGMNAAIAKLGLAPMRHRFTVERITSP